MYRWLFDNLITHSNPETAHKLAMEALRVASANPATRAALKATFNRADTSLPPDASFLPKRLHGRLGLAAGMDKNAEAIAAFIALGFGFVEIGTITPKPQPGNPTPRLWRIPETQEIRNQMGFNNYGVEAALGKLKRLRATESGKALVVGANIGKNKVTPNSEALNDYRTCALLCRQ